ncbi:MAG: L-threonine 3-dehydrogenase [Candidatus Melainabacteria bacterium]
MVSAIQETGFSVDPQTMSAHPIQSPIATQTMKAIRKPGAAPGFAWIDAPIPTPGAGEVLIKVAMAAVCGTDYHITSWDAWSAGRIKPPLIYGHEFCGHVHALGEGVEGEYPLKPGDYVSAEMHLPCETCRQCASGNRHICESVEIYGIDRPGCYAEYVVLPAKLVVRLPENIPVEYGAFLDSLGNAVHAVSKVDVTGKTVHVAGCGPMGLFAIAVAKAEGARAVYASDVSDFRLDLARQAGADAVHNALSGPASALWLQSTGGQGVDVVLEMSGSPQAIQDAFTSLCKAGAMVMMGIPKGPVPLDLSNSIIFPEATIIGCNGRRIFETWDRMLALLAEDRLNLDFIITHRLPMSAFEEAMQLVGEGKSGKILLDPSC